MGQYKKAAHIDEIPPGKMKSVELEFNQIVICHTEDGFFALSNECSHDSAPISNGRISREGQIVCPRHGARFDCKSGEVKAPPAVVGIDTYEIKIENDEIFILVD